MKAQLKELFSLELVDSLEEFYPENEYNFGFSVRLMIGLDDGMGSESFDMFVCTPDWIKSHYTEEGYLWGFQTLIVLKYDFDLIKTEIARQISYCTGNSWIEIARKLSKLGAWEFENYQTDNL